MDFENPNFDAIDWADVEWTVLEMKEHRAKDDPYYDICSDCWKPIGIHNDGGNGFCIDCAPNH